MLPFTTGNLPAKFARICGRLRPLLLILSVLSGESAWAQAYNWKPVVINGGGYVDGIVFHPNAPGLMYCRIDIGAVRISGSASYATNGVFSLAGAALLTCDVTPHRAASSCGRIC